MLIIEHIYDSIYIQHHFAPNSHLYKMQILKWEKSDRGKFVNRLKLNYDIEQFGLDKNSQNPYISISITMSETENTLYQLLPELK